MRTNRLWIMALCVLLAGPGLLGSHSAAAQAPTTLVIAQSEDLRTGDPHKTLPVPTTIVLHNLYDTLVTRDAQYRLKPGLATSWRMVDPTTWEFKLRTGVSFHNGEPFNARAVKYSFDRALDPRTRWQNAGNFRVIKSVTVVDDTTVRIITERPWPVFVNNMPFFGPRIVPPDYVTQNGEEALAQRPVGTGPYRFVSWMKDDRLELAANLSYWGGAPKIRRVVIRAIPNDATRLAELMAGSVDLINLIGPSVVSPIKQSGRNKVVSSASGGIYLVQLNLVNLPRDRPLSDRRVRQAINLAINRKAIVENVMHGSSVIVPTFCIRFSLGCDTTLPPYVYDPQRARILLQEAGYPNGIDFTIVTTDGAYPQDRDVTLAIADQLNKVGIRTKVVVEDSGNIARAVSGKQFTADGLATRYTDYTGVASGIPVRGFHPRGAFSLWVPGVPEATEMMDRAEFAPDEATLRDAVRRLQLLFKDEAPMIPLFTSPNIYGMKRELNITPRPDYLIDLVTVSWGAR